MSIMSTWVHWNILPVRALMKSSFLSQTTTSMKAVGLADLPLRTHRSLLPRWMPTHPWRLRHDNDSLLLILSLFKVFFVYLRLLLTGPATCYQNCREKHMETDAMTSCKFSCKFTWLVRLVSSSAKGVLEALGYGAMDWSKIGQVVGERVPARVQEKRSWHGIAFHCNLIWADSNRIIPAKRQID